MSAGRYRHRITVQYCDRSTKNDYNAPIEDWKDLGQLWASIEPLTGREHFAASQTQAELTHVIKARWHTGWYTEPGFFITPMQLAHTDDKVRVTPNTRIKFGDRIFDVLSVANVGERDRAMELRCKEQV